MQVEHHSVLLVSKDTKIVPTITALLMPPIFEVTVSKDFNEARRKLNEQTYNIIIVDSGDGYDTDFAIDVSDSNATILLLAPTHMFDQISYRVEGNGIITMTKPFDTFYFYNMIKVAIAVEHKIAKISSQAVKLKNKLDEIRLTNRAKMLLMQHKSMTEEEAHRFLEKEAMDRCIKRKALAEEVIRKYSE